MKEKRPEGRPSKYKPEYCEMLIDHMSEGFTFESFGGVVSVNRDTVYEWLSAHPEFSDSLKVARVKQMQANEKLIRDIAKYGEGNATAAIFILKNCHPKEWRDRREIDIAPPKSMSTEDLVKEAEELLARVKK